MFHKDREELQTSSGTYFSCLVRKIDISLFYLPKSFRITQWNQHLKIYEKKRVVTKNLAVFFKVLTKIHPEFDVNTSCCEFKSIRVKF